MRSRSEEAIVRRMSAVHVRMPDAAEHREVVAMILHLFEVRRELVAFAYLIRFRKKFLWKQAEVIAHAEESAWSLDLCRRTGKGGKHCVEQGKREANAGSAEELAA